MKIYLLFNFNNIGAFYSRELDSLMLLSNREGSFRTEGSPMES